MPILKKPNKKPLKILGVIGNPVSHSLSPLMQNAALAKLKLPYLYKAFELTQKELKKFTTTLIQENIIGFNVTIPHKENITRYLDQLTPEAKLMGAVNTVYRRGNRLVGDNTDGRGYLNSLLKEARFNPKKEVIVILGAGGAAKGISLALAREKPRELIIVNRTLTKAQSLKKQIQIHNKKLVVSAVSLEDMQIINWSTVSLLVNTTSVGLKTKGTFLIPFKKCNKKLIVSDIVYAPALTPFLRRAKKNGLKIHYGWGMLLYQGALAFELFTGKKAPINLMKKVLLEALKE